MIRGDRVVAKVCWRKLAGAGDPPSHLSESTEDRPARRLQVDDSIGALWESATDTLDETTNGAGKNADRRPQHTPLGPSMTRNIFGG